MPRLRPTLNTSTRLPDSAIRPDPEREPEPDDDRPAPRGAGGAGVAPAAADDERTVERSRRGGTVALPQANAPPSEWLTKRELAELLRLNTYTVSKIRRRDSTFPSPTWLSDSTPRWRRSEIDAWLLNRPRTPRSPKYDRDLSHDRVPLNQRRRGRVVRPHRVED